MSEYGLILLKCHGCKTPTVFRLEIRHEAEPTGHYSKTYCTRCEREDPLTGKVLRKLKPKLVDNQRIDPGGAADICHEANGGDKVDV